MWKYNKQEDIDDSNIKRLGDYGHENLLKRKDG